MASQNKLEIFKSILSEVLGPTSEVTADSDDPSKFMASYRPGEDRCVAVGSLALDQIEANPEEMGSMVSAMLKEIANPLKESDDGANSTE